jgi:hypothetical protein
VHPGAAAFFNGTQESFMDRYGKPAIIEAGNGTSDPDNSCLATKLQLTHDFDAAESVSCTTAYLSRRWFSKQKHCETSSGKNRPCVS